MPTDDWIHRHTPRPWFRHDDLILTEPPSEDALVIAEVDVSATATLEEFEANGDLIVAAPDLLEAVETALRILDCYAASHPYKQYPVARQMFRAAIAKTNRSCPREVNASLRTSCCAR